MGYSIFKHELHFKKNWKLSLFLYMFIVNLVFRVFKQLNDYK